MASNQYRLERGIRALLCELRTKLQEAGREEAGYPIVPKCSTHLKLSKDLNQYHQEGCDPSTD